MRGEELWPRAVRYHTTAGGPLTSSGSGGDDGGGGGDDGGGSSGGGGGGDGSDGGGGDAEKARPSTTKKYGIAALAHAHAMPSPIAAANEADAAGAARPVEEERAADEVRGPRVPSPRGRRRIVRRTIRCSTLAARCGPRWRDQCTPPAGARVFFSYVEKSDSFVQICDCVPSRGPWQNS